MSDDEPRALYPFRKRNMTRLRTRASDVPDLSPTAMTPEGKKALATFTAGQVAELEDAA